MKLNRVPALRGLTWVRQGMRTFWRQPLAMSGLFLMFMGLVTVLMFVPVVGKVLALGLVPAATLGLMTAARLSEQGRFPMPHVLGAAFAAGRERALAMGVLGALYVAGVLLMLGLTALVDGGQFAQAYMGSTGLGEEQLNDPAVEAAAWVGLAGYTLLSALFWHAPALVHWHGVAPVKSLFFSLLGCWQNKAALAVYMLGWTGVFVIGAVLISVVVAALGETGMAAALVFPVILVMAAMFFSSIHFSFDDSFLTDPAESPESAA
ncbi:BPSS1780 family membrane protein [Hydrogenophaga soli]|nr:BPSS1780 family membrane protein [Burkholderiaceae bacterium]